MNLNGKEMRGFGREVNGFGQIYEIAGLHFNLRQLKEDLRTRVEFASAHDDYILIVNQKEKNHGS